MKFTTDVLIIGGGISGTTLAIKLALLNEDIKIMLITKEKLENCNTFHAQGGIACAWSEKDDFSKHARDTLIAGDGLCNEEVVKRIISQAPERINDLIEWGVKFTRNERGEIDLGKEGGHSERRILHANDLTGKEIEQKLLQKLREFSNIEIHEHWCAINLYARNLKCYGVHVLDDLMGEIYNIAAKITVLATGGAGKIYLYTTNPDVASGDGIAMAYRAGASIMNMEFYQFHPTCLYHPYAKSFLISEALRGEGAILKDLKGNAFMEKYHPLKELAPRDIVSRAIDAELKKSGDDFVYLDIASYREPEFIKNHFPGIYQKCLEFNIDITRESIPVVPAAHYCCGGIKSTISGKTDVKRLFVVGESACTGLHGANRLASNSLLEGLVMAHKCALEILELLPSLKLKEFKEWESGIAVPSSEGVMITQNWDEIRMTMMNLVGIVRSDNRLKRALKRMRLFSEEIDYYYWNYKITKDLIELRNLSMVAEIIIRCAMSRKESRGAHFNIDHPEKTEFPRDSIIRRPW
ncbi:MAG: L-aspartate oxidase [Promethearchaeota archaeon]